MGSMVGGRAQDQFTPRIVLCLVSLFVGMGLLLYSMQFAYDRSVYGMIAMFVGPSAVVMVPIAGLMLYVFSGQASRVAAYFGDDRLVARWVYDEDEWHQYARRYHRGLLRTVCLFIAAFDVLFVVGVGACIWEQGTDRMLTPIVILLGILMMGNLLSLFVVWLPAYVDSLTRTGVAYIGKDAILIGGALHEAVLDPQFRDVSLLPGPPPAVRFSWRYYDQSSETAKMTSTEIPVPRSASVDVKEIVQFFAKA